MTPFETRIREIGAHAKLVRPEGPGPFPVVVQLHGCGGQGQNQLRWAEEAARVGWAAVALDSYGFRGIARPEAVATICTGLRFWGRERAGDLYAGLEWVRRQPWADASRLVAAGWSHGGWTVVEAMALRPEQRARTTKLEGLPEAPLAGLAGAFLVYPYLGVAALAPRQGLRHRAPIQAIVGGRDVTVGSSVPLRALNALRAKGAEVEVELFETATHDFDEPCVEGGLRAPGSRYDHAAALRAQHLYRDFLKRIAA